MPAPEGVMVPFAAAYWRARRVMAGHQHGEGQQARRHARRTPLLVLLAGEIRWLAREAARRRSWRPGG